MTFLLVCWFFCLQKTSFLSAFLCTSVCIFFFISICIFTVFCQYFCPYFCMFPAFLFAPFFLRSHSHIHWATPIFSSAEIWLLNLSPQSLLQVLLLLFNSSWYSDKLEYVWGSKVTSAFFSFSSSSPILSFSFCLWNCVFGSLSSRFCSLLFWDLLSFLFCLSRLDEPLIACDFWVLLLLPDEGNLHTYYITNTISNEVSYFAKQPYLHFCTPTFPIFCF